MGIRGEPITSRSKDKRVTSAYSSPCDSCRTGDHSKCWRVACYCQHEGWERDPNAQVPHGMAAGASKEHKNYDGEGKVRRGGGKKEPTYSIIDSAMGY